MIVKGARIGFVSGCAVLAIGCLAMLFMVMGASEPPMTHGVVVDLRHEPAHSITTMVSTGKVMVPMTTPVPAKWQVVLSDGERMEIFSVPQGDWDLLSVGDSVPVGVGWR